MITERIGQLVERVRSRVSGNVPHVVEQPPVGPDTYEALWKLFVGEDKGTMCHDHFPTRASRGRWLRSVESDFRRQGRRFI